MKQLRAKKAMPRDGVSKEEDAPRGRGSKSGGGQRAVEERWKNKEGWRNKEGSI